MLGARYLAKIFQPKTIAGKMDSPMSRPGGIDIRSRVMI
jgi:hypothetical protein